jgi:hypothetical protein
MSEPVWFVVEQWHGRTRSMLYFGWLPKVRKGLNRRIFEKRIDDQPHLAGRARQELHDIWETLGTLPDASELESTSGWWN